MEINWGWKIVASYIISTIQCVNDVFDGFNSKETREIIWLTFTNLTLKIQLSVAKWVYVRDWRIIERKFY